MGGLLMVLSFVYVVPVAAVNTLFAADMPPAVRDQAGIGLTVPVSNVFGLVVLLTATRAFTRVPFESGPISAGSLPGASAGRSSRRSART